MSASENPRAAFEAFQARVIEDPALLSRLCDRSDLDGFAARTVALGRELGFVFGAGHVRSAWAAASRTWREQA